MERLMPILLILPVAAFLLVALLSHFQAGFRPKALKKVAILSVSINLLAATVAFIYTALNDGTSLTFLSYSGLSLALRIDALNSVLWLMVNIIALVVFLYSFRYLDGDPKQGAFIGRMSATIAPVILILLSGSLSVLLVSWITTSIGLNRLLLFYPERLGARKAAAKKFIMARVSDLTLLLASVALIYTFKTDNLETIFQEVRNQELNQSTWTTIALWSLVLSALFKSAQFPFHGWLVEVMETPTPVSALLHAGLLNAGPFLMLRMAPLLSQQADVSNALVIVGGFTALFGSVVYTTQSAVKTALSYSSAGHMGFSLMLCGLGLYPAAVLHIIAHSFYKAHAFLSSGSIIEQFRGNRSKVYQQKGNISSLIGSVVLSFLITFLTAKVFGFNLSQETGMLLLCMVISSGISLVLSQSLDTDGPLTFKMKAGMYASFILLMFFSLESILHLWTNTIFPVETETIISQLPAWIIGASFMLIIGIQIFRPVIPWQGSKMHIHLRNGLYVNTIFDRLIQAWDFKK